MEHRMELKKRYVAFILLVILLFIPVHGSKIFPYILISIIGCIFILGFNKSRMLFSLGYLFYVITYLLSLFIHYYYGTITLSMVFLAYALFSPLITYKTIKTEEDFNFTINFLIFLFTIYSIFGIIECISGFNIFDYVFHRTADNYTRLGIELSRGFMTVMHNNATLMGMAWAISAYRICNTTKKEKRKWIVCWFLIGTYTLLMMSRMVIFCSILLQLTIFKKNGVVWLTKRIFLIIGIVSAFLLFSTQFSLDSITNTLGLLFFPIIDELFGTSLTTTKVFGVAGSGQRTILWEWIFSAIKDDFLFGKGYTTIWSTTITGKNELGQIWTTTKTSIEVTWLSILYRTGLFGLSGFITYQFSVLRKVFKANKLKCEDKVTFQYVMKWTVVLYFLQLFGIAAAEDLHFFYLFYAIFVAYSKLGRLESCICDNFRTGGK